MAQLILFLFGLAIGSFINVIALRYDGEHFLFDPKMIGGRSRCPHCGRTLAAFELIPVVSFFAQGGRCRGCGARIGLHYPLVELLSGLIFAAVPAGGPYALSALWIIALELLLLAAYVDIRLQIVPDEISVMLGAVAIFAAIFSASPAPGQGAWLSRLAGAVFGAGFFGAIIFFYAHFRKGTEGGMGMGDVKLGLPLGFLFGWPDILLVYASAFIAGSVAGLVFIARKEKTMKSALPFVPFLASGAAFTFFFGARAIAWYFRIIGI